MPLTPVCPRRAAHALVAAVLLAVLASPALPAAAQGPSDPLLAIETHRAAIVERIVARFGHSIEQLGSTREQLRAQLEALRADHLLAASLVEDLASLDLARPVGGLALQRYVAIEPVPAEQFAGASEALAYVVRRGGTLEAIPARELAAWRRAVAAEDRVVGYFADAGATITLAPSAVLKDGAGTGPGSWIGYTGGNNQATAQGAAVMAGLNNTASGAVSTVVAGNGNMASGQGALIGGGDNHQASGNYAVIVGGYQNSASGVDAVIAGGVFNVNSGTRSLLGGGARNQVGAAGGYGVLGGGGCNVVTGMAAVVVGGGETDPQIACPATDAYGNLASAPHASVGGGRQNIASAAGSVVPGGLRNTASGTASVAMGYRAKTQSPAGSAHFGSLVFADLFEADFHSAGNNTFNIRAGGGVHLSPSTSLRFAAQPRQHIALAGDPGVAGQSIGIGAHAGAMYQRLDGGATGPGFAWYRGGMHSDTPDDPGAGGAVLMRLDRSGNLTTAGAINPPSDAALKTAFERIDPRQVLARVLALPITRWSYRSEAERGVRHIGPTAQDFRRAFGLGGGDTTIATVDADGVALAAIQGLHAELAAERRALDARSARLEMENRVLRERLAAETALLSARNDRLASELAALRDELRALGARPGRAR